MKSYHNKLVSEEDDSGVYVVDNEEKITVANEIGNKEVINGIKEARRVYENHTEGKWKPDCSLRRRS